MRVADYLVYLVEDFTSVDQRAVHRLARSMREKSRCFPELIIVHNMRAVTDTATLNHAWFMQVTALYGYGEQQVTSVLLAAHDDKPPVRCDVTWFKTRGTRHLLLAQHVSDAGAAYNAPTIALLRMWIQSAYVPIDGKRHGLLGQVLRLLSSRFLSTI